MSSWVFSGGAWALLELGSEAVDEGAVEAGEGS